MSRCESLVRWLAAAPLLAAPLAAPLAALGCARPVAEVATPEPAVSARARTVEVPPRFAHAGSWKLSVSASREHGCSRSWESVWDEVRFDLAIDDAARARLSVESTHSVTFGSNPRFGAGAASPSRRETRSSARHVGRARGAAEAFEIALSPDATWCEAKGTSCGAAFVLECRLARLEIEGKAAGDAGPSRTQVSGLRCSVPAGLDEAVERELTLGLPLAPTPGLALRVNSGGGGGGYRELTLAERD